MPSLGHLAVGLAAGRFHAGADRPRLVPAVAFTALATFPDLDVLARALGESRGSPWLHRGALHSLLVALLVGIVAALAMGGLGRSRWRMMTTATLVAASHGVLDAFTRGGGGVMFLWPLSLARYLSPWHLLPAAPLGFRFMSPRGLEVLLREAVVFSPLLLYAFWPARRAPTLASHPHGHEP